MRKEGGTGEGLRGREGVFYESIFSQYVETFYQANK